MRVTNCTVRMPAKINLCLGVGPRRRDGFHELATVFQAVDLYDKISVRQAADITLTMPGSESENLPLGDKNLAVKAAKLLRLRHGSPDMGVHIENTKKIPVAGGMAGGSGNAAGVLLACNKLWGLDLSDEQLHALALELGSDVPFMLSGGTALGFGRGEELTQLPHSGKLNWVLATNRQGLSTPRVFETFDAMGANGDVSSPDDLVQALKRPDADAVAGLLRNDLQPAALSMRPDLKNILKAGIEAGALSGLVSGSGPTCVFLVKDRRAARKVGAAVGSCMGVASALAVSGPAVPSVRINTDGE